LDFSFKACTLFVFEFLALICERRTHSINSTAAEGRFSKWHHHVSGKFLEEHGRCQRGWSTDLIWLTQMKKVTKFLDSGYSLLHENV
jgi:hypothetical protein